MQPCRLSTYTFRVSLTPCRLFPRTIIERADALRSGLLQIPREFALIRAQIGDTELHVLALSFCDLRKVRYDSNDHNKLPRELHYPAALQKSTRLRSLRSRSICFHSLEIRFFRELKVVERCICIQCAGFHFRL